MVGVMGLAMLLFLISIIGVWVSAGLIVHGVSSFAKHLKLSSFTVAFFVLGLLTSIPELTVGLNSIREGDPNIFMGNLIGASVALFLLVIPLLAVVGKGIELDKNLTGKNLSLALLVIFSTVIFGIDGSYSRVEAVFMVLLYIVLFFVLKRRKGLLGQITDSLFNGHESSWKDVAKIIIGAVIIYFSSNLLVEQTQSIAHLMGVSTFMVGLLILGVGTNVPELVIGVRSVLQNQKSVAFGNYVGSAAANTLLFGFFTLITGTIPAAREKIWIVLLFFLIGIVLFYFFVKTKSHLSRREGIFLLIIYVLFLIAETFRRLREVDIPLIGQ